MEVVKEREVILVVVILKEVKASVVMLEVVKILMVRSVEGHCLESVVLEVV